LASRPFGLQLYNREFIEEILAGFIARKKGLNRLVELQGKAELTDDENEEIEYLIKQYLYELGREQAHRKTNGNGKAKRRTPPKTAISQHPQQKRHIKKRPALLTMVSGDTHLKLGPAAPPPSLFSMLSAWFSCSMGQPNLSGGDRIHGSRRHRICPGLYTGGGCVQCAQIYRRTLALRLLPRSVPVGSTRCSRVDGFQSKRMQCTYF
jgi:hypothetical protein